MISDLGSHLGYWLRYVSNHVSHGFARKLEGEGVTVAEWVVMRELYDVERTAPSRLAGRLGMTRGAITKLADRLIGKSLLTRKADPRDGRAQTVMLTPRGRKLVPELARLADRNDAEFFDHLSAADRRAMERILREIVERRELKAVPVD
jgi:DNA-binding MarR family transcriptional regulator